MTTTCHRSWEVEAARDGRLTGEARASFDTHAAGCPSCRGAANGLESLANGLRGLGSAEVDDVSLRRLRGRVLEAVDAEQTGRVEVRAHRARSSARIAALVGAAAVVAVVAFFSLPGSKAAAPALVAYERPAASAETRVEVEAGAGARYTRTVSGDVERFDLVDGTLRLRVVRAAGGRRVLVKVPDGEIEDVGTTFEVVVRDGHTERVGVDEGRVVARLAALAPVTVEAGSVWTRSVVAIAVPPSAADASAPVSTRANGKARTEADREDAAYLEVLRLLREGREGEAQSGADAYVRSFPAGFRREEMERVARGRAGERQLP